MFSLRQESLWAPPMTRADHWVPSGKCQYDACDGTRFEWGIDPDPRNSAYFCVKCGGMQIPPRATEDEPDWKSILDNWRALRRVNEVARLENERATGNDYGRRAMVELCDMAVRDLETALSRPISSKWDGDAKEIDTDELRAALKWFDEHAQIDSTSIDDALHDERQRNIHRRTLVRTINVIDFSQKDLDCAVATPRSNSLTCVTCQDWAGWRLASHGECTSVLNEVCCGLRVRPEFGCVFHRPYEGRK